MAGGDEARCEHSESKENPVASSEVVAPHDLESLKRPLIETAINAYMRKLDDTVRFENDDAYDGSAGSSIDWK